MKTKLLLSILFLSALYQSNAQNVLPAMKARPADYEYLSAPDSLGVRHELKMPNKNKKTLLNQAKLPYPIIFIHGLNSCSSVWNTFTNFLDTNQLIYGGRFDVNLNYDGNNYTSNKNVYPTNGADIAMYQSNNLIQGDYYYVNFSVGTNGVVFNTDNTVSIYCDNLSNQAAVAKQGKALQNIIDYVMYLTNSTKVILFGHSMGGLASREYLQNNSNWQADGHHIAKLITTGTPHGGYTGTNVAAITNINSYSEAYRDLRKEYSNTNQGVFLSGGYENTSNIGNGYYNNDINCNGINNDGSYIQGLNQKDLPTDTVDFAYIMGNCTNCVISQGLILGDGVVRLENANLSNFYTLPNHKNEFIYSASAVTEIHTDLPMQTYQNMQGLDEPNEFNLAYGVNFGNTYMGFTTVQPAGGYSNDYDIYKFLAQGNGNLTFTITNSSVNNITVQIKNYLGQVQGQVYTIPNGNWYFSVPISSGSGIYYAEITGIPSSISYLYPYTFNMTYTLSNQDFTSSDTLKIYPNPTSSKISFDNSKENFNQGSIYNYLGQEVSKITLNLLSSNQEVDLSNLSNGVYILKFSNGEITKSVKVIKQ